jgi:hypothetical protein
LAGRAFPTIFDQQHAWRTGRAFAHGEDRSHAELLHRRHVECLDGHARHAAKRLARAIDECFRIDGIGRLVDEVAREMDGVHERAAVAAVARLRGVRVAGDDGQRIVQPSWLRRRRVDIFITVETIGAEIRADRKLGRGVGPGAGEGLGQQSDWPDIVRGFRGRHGAKILDALGVERGRPGADDHDLRPRPDAAQGKH